ncbi:hypothetical protein BU23DRAFT_563900 [Bimuria novae-zelandiae CBS 107.79]|uniref:Uncharacterized protein n=1 Tax=Bimuria novae-zelandiae CBS 107.79 TaxID=1447943 RepID=A0A6A5VMW3_9PLEO|nr:hypothetical protein BU23DRAFT_563900 [Bimuria novae-zelandiae CBS 107.79]
MASSDPLDTTLDEIQSQIIETLNRRLTKLEAENNPCKCGSISSKDEQIVRPAVGDGPPKPRGRRYFTTGVLPLSMATGQALGQATEAHENFEEEMMEVDSRKQSEDQDDEAGVAGVMSMFREILARLTAIEEEMACWRTSGASQSSTHSTQSRSFGSATSMGNGSELLRPTDTGCEPAVDKSNKSLTAGQPEPSRRQRRSLTSEEKAATLQRLRAQLVAEAQQREQQYRA